MRKIIFGFFLSQGTQRNKSLEKEATAADPAQSVDSSPTDDEQQEDGSDKKTL